MNKKLRLLVTAQCENKCQMCCNNQFYIKHIRTITITEATQQYEEINITGGNPLYVPIIERVGSYIKHIRKIEQFGDIPKRTVYIYTNTCKYSTLKNVVENWPIDGITITPHTKRELDEFIELNFHVKFDPVFVDALDNMSFRLNIMPECRKQLNDMPLWEGFKIKSLDWVEDCPIPKDEDFRRIPLLL